MLKRNKVVARDQFTVKQCNMVQKQKTDLLLIFQSSEVPDLVIMFFSQLC